MSVLEQAVAAAALAAAAGFTGCASAPQATEGPGGLDRPALTRGEFRRELLLTGELRATRSVAVKSPETNVFQMRITFMAEEGSFVAEGDALLDFDNSALADQVRELESRILDAEVQIVSQRNQLASALKDLEIELAEAEYDYGRTKLDAEIDPSVVSKKEYGERRLAFTRATEELEEVRARIELTRERGRADLDVLEINRDKLRKDLLTAGRGVELLSIKAPTAGLVVYEQRQGTTLRYQEGDSCWPGQGIVSLPDLSAMKVVFSVNEVDAPLLDVGMPVEIIVDAFPGRPLSGEVTRIPSMAVKRDDQSKIAVFKIDSSLSETWVGEMKPGMSVLGRVVVERRGDVPLIDRRAVRFDGERYWLQVQGDGGTPVDGPQLEPVARNARYYVLSEEAFARLNDGTSSPVVRNGEEVS